MADNPKLTVLFEKLRGKTFELDREQMSIGRRDGMDICIKDSSLSGHHADIFRTERDGKAVFILRDNESTNGTRINNVPVTGEQELKNSDLILFGGVEVLFDSNEQGESGSYTKTHTIDISNIDTSVSSVPTLTNLNPFAGKDEKKHAVQQKIVIACVAVVALLLVALVIWVVINMMQMGENSGKAQLRLPERALSSTVV